MIRSFHRCQIIVEQGFRDDFSLRILIRHQLCLELKSLTTTNF